MREKLTVSRLFYQIPIQGSILPEILVINGRSPQIVVEHKGAWLLGVEVEGRYGTDIMKPYGWSHKEFSYLNRRC